MKLTFEHNSQTFPLDLTLTGKSYRVQMGDESVDVEILRVDAEHGQLELLIDGRRVKATISSDEARRWVTVDGRTFVLTKVSGKGRKTSGHDHTSGLAAPMPGLVRSVHVEEGEAVVKGQTLLVLEAMKMEIRIQAPRDGVVKKLFVRQGQTVEREQMLVEIE